jgi:hypothetical protein
MVLITLGPETDFQYDFKFQGFVTFDKIEPIAEMKSLESPTLRDTKSTASFALSKQNVSV